LAAVNRRLVAQSEDGEAGGSDGGAEAFRDYPRPQVIVNSADEKSGVAAQRVREVLDSWTDELLKERLRVAELPEHVIDPVHETRLDIAEDRQKSALIWSKLFPALLVLMTVTGAFNPAVDLAAGEKERGTMETLLISPAARSEIVLGKFFTVMVFSVSTALLNLVSMGLTSRYLASVAQGGTLSRIGSLEPPSLGALAWVIVLLLPLAGLFSALCLALATFARSTKEGQYYLTPLLMIAVGLTMFCLTPLAEIDPLYSLLPVMNVALLLKEVLADPSSTRALTFAVPVMVTSVGYSLLALWWAIEQFAREDVLFREAERFSVRAWFTHLLRDKEPTPSFAEAAICFGLLMLLQFFSLSFMQRSFAAGPPEAQGERMLQVVMIQQLALLATPALLMGIMLTTSVRKTFRLMWPRWNVFAVALVLPLLLHPVAMELLSFLQGRLFHRLDPSLQEKLGAMMGQPLWLVLLGAAVAPAVCEEIAFRGFALSGFSRSGRVWLAIVLSAMAFGLIHMIPQQVFNGALLGIVLGLIAVRSGSLLPTVCFHLIWNTLGVLHGRLGELVDVPALVETPVLKWFVVLDGHSVGYRWPTLLIGAASSAALIAWLVKQPSDPRALPETALAPPDTTDVPLDILPPAADRSPVGA
jgi:sodium transport system permease protein